MKLLLSLFLIVILNGLASAQLPPIGIIDFYGLRSITPEQARAALQIREGDEVSESTIAAARKRLENLPNVEQVRISSVCCAEGKTILYVGISEKGASVLRFRSAPMGKFRLSDEIVETGEEFSKAHERAILAGDAEEDTSSGHSLMKNLEARRVQEKFIRIAGQNIKLLRRVLRKSADAEHRALAADIIAYAQDKRGIVADLVDAMSDPDEAVRNNSMRALGLIAELAQSNPKLKIKVPFAPFVRMLHSVEWTDRNKSSLALLRLTENRNQKLLAELKQKALPSLIEMACWTSPGHSIAPLIILARVADVSDEEIQKSLGDNRKNLLETILKKLGLTD